MLHRSIRVAGPVAVLLMIAVPSAFAQPTPGQAMPSSAIRPLPFVSPIFADNMVLQRSRVGNIG